MMRRNVWAPRPVRPSVSRRSRTSGPRPEVTRELVETWYRQRAHTKFAERLEVNLLRFPAPDDFRPKGLIVRQLRQRWGSMSPASRLLLNRRLIGAPMDAIDYVITHELCHIAVPHHGPEFLELLDRVLPEAICTFALDRGAVLLVMGGYGHLRLRQFSLGGARRAMLDDPGLPTMLSH